MIGVGREGVGGNHPRALGGELRRDVELVEALLVRELERHQRQLLGVLGTDDREVSDGRDVLRELAGIGLHGVHDVAVAVAAEPDEVVVLGDDHRGACREVQGERRVTLAEVVLVEDQVLGQV